MTNTAPNGIRYGYISAQSLNMELVDQLLYGSQAVDLSYQWASREYRAEAERAAETLEEEVRIAAAELDYALLSNDNLMKKMVEEAYHKAGHGDRDEFIGAYIEQQLDGWYCEEPSIEGEYEGVKYQSSWLGGALNVWIFESPHTGRFAECSPCVPGAGNLDRPDADGVLTYDVPPDWRES